ncbi:FecR family protein [Chitinophaga polysaccharea]|uniref:FecR family protein n=1 Tax=Chitinophaga polysaccharea TaxID=1293035 RepID=UPI00115B6B43|nr:FecR family protein [Chitinophaga polysaccharea]
MEQRITFLLKKSGEEGLTAAEEKELTAFFQDEANRELFNSATAAWPVEIPGDEAADTVNWEPVLQNILLADKPGNTPVKIMYRKWWQYAAAIVFIVAASGAWFLLQHRKQVTHHVPEVAAVIAPGANKAVLQLSNGKTIVLSDTQNGVVGQQGSAQVVKTDNGVLAYQRGTAAAGNTVEYNTMITPRGGQFRIVLQDGSTVWLNAASSLKYPVEFNGAERVVELTGEAYFEVAARPGQPFRVKSKGQEVLVLGTHFNINAYPDEAMTTTTLITGKVKVSGAGYAGVLQPGEQVQQQENSQWQLLKNVDTETVMAWKNGYFSFNKANIVTVMRQLARWYDVNVIFETKNTEQAFVGEIPRNVSLDKALEILQFSNVHYVITGRTIRIID